MKNQKLRTSGSVTDPRYVLIYGKCFVQVPLSSGSPRTSLREDPGQPPKTTGIDPQRAPDCWSGGRVIKPTPEVGDHPGVLSLSLRIRSKLAYAKGSDAGPPQVGAGSLSFFGFLWFVVAFLVLPAGFPTLLVLV